MSTLTVAGFGATDVNGTYTSDGTHDGYTLYKKSTTHLIMYATKWGPISDAAAYYILELGQIQGAIPIWKTMYRLANTSVTATGWEAIFSSYSTEKTIGTVT